MMTMAILCLRKYDISNDIINKIFKTMFKNETTKIFFPHEVSCMCQSDIEMLASLFYDSNEQYCYVGYVKSLEDDELKPLIGFPDDFSRYANSYKNKINLENIFGIHINMVMVWPMIT